MSDALREFVRAAKAKDELTVRHHQVEFRGDVMEYFGIWIVNVLLSIVTAGVYSAWAKIRDRKYFYGNTFIDDHNFDYHAKGIQILIGRLIVVTILGVLWVASQVSFNLYMGLYFIFILFVGFIVSRALRFNARMSSYRNVRFNFDGNGFRAFLSYVLYPFGAWFSMNLLKPFVTLSKNRYTTNHHYYGDRSFEFDADVGEYYPPFLITIAFGFVAIIGSLFFMGAIMALGAGILSAFGVDFNDDSLAAMLIFIPILLVYAGMFLAFFGVGQIYKAAVRNIIFNNAILDGKHEFVSTVEAPKYVWIIVTNTLLSLLTLGLMIPWGKIRLAKYMASKTEVLAGGDLGGYTSTVIETHGVTAAEYADIEGFDIDLGL